MNTLPQVLPTVTVTAVSPLCLLDAKTPDELWLDGFQMFADCVRTGDYLSAEELAAMTPGERRGYNDAISAADYAETSAYLYNTNAYGDATMGGW
jgi:hypothetical protein